MTLETTARHALPLLSAGQAQKEIAHNEALSIVDFMMNPIVESAGADMPPLSPAVGLAWIVGTAPVEAWSGHANALACSTEGGWRFVAPMAGLHVWRRDTGVFCVFDGSGWNSGIVAGSQFRVGGVQVVGSQSAAISDASGGSIIDIQARAAVSQILSALRVHGLISS
jgi:hypothetical protein